MILTYVAAVAVLVAIGYGVFLFIDSDVISDPDDDTHVTAITGAAIETTDGSPEAEIDGAAGMPAQEARDSDEAIGGLDGGRTTKSAAVQSVTGAGTSAAASANGFSRAAASTAGSPSAMCRRWMRPTEHRDARLLLEPAGRTVRGFRTA